MQKTKTPTRVQKEREKKSNNFFGSSEFIEAIRKRKAALKKASK